MRLRFTSTEKDDVAGVQPGSVHQLVLVLVVVLLAALVPGSALASSPGGPNLTPGNTGTVVPRVADGPGLKVGNNSTFHGGAALSIGFDSNVFSEQRTVAVTKDGSTIYEFRGPAKAAYSMPSVWLSLGNRGMRGGLLDTPTKRAGRKVDYHINFLMGWRIYMARNRAVRQASKPNIGLNMRFLFAPGRRFSFAIEDDTYFVGEPVSFQVLREWNFNRIDNSLALRFTLRPSGGRISLDVAYRNEVLYFLSNRLADTSDRTVNGVETELKYRVRDRSALAVRYSFHYTTYFCCVETGTGRNEDSQAHRVLGGYVGQLGKKVVLELMAGYGAGLYKLDANGPNHTNFIGYAALGVFPTASGKTQIGLRLGRSFHDSLFGNFMSDVGGSLAAGHEFRWKMRFDAGFGVYARRYAGLPIPGQDIQTIAEYVNAPGFVRRDTLVSANLQLEQPFGKYAVVGARYTVAADITDFQVRYVDAFLNQFDEARFNRHLVMLFAAVRY